jgi:curved DNA-binding protein
MMGPNISDDYYEILQISQRADQETIERVYRLLAKRYHPDNKVTGDELKFERLLTAFRILSDPEKRAAYDVSYESTSAQDWGRYFQASPSEGAEEDKRIYQAVLAILYKARRRDAEKSAIGVVELEKLLGVPEKHLSFHIWYLKEKKWIQRDENGGFSISAEGADEVINKGFPLRMDRLLENHKDSTDDLVSPNNEKQS